MAELVAELIVLTPQDQEVPDKLAADQAIQFVITGDRPNDQLQLPTRHRRRHERHRRHPRCRPVTVYGTHGTAIGSKTASGANSSVVGSQTAQGDHDAIAGRDTTNTGTNEQPAKEGWWARLRTRGMVVAFSTIIGGIAAVAGTIVAALAWIGWTPLELAQWPVTQRRGAARRAGRDVAGRRI